MDDQVADAARAQAGAAARGARGQGDRHAADRAQCADALRAPGPAGHGSGRRDHRDAAAVPLRPRDRGRPDRGGGAHRSATTSCRPRRRWRRSRPSCRRRRAAAASRVRRLLAALGYQETINFSFVEERWEKDLAGNADPIQLLNPIASQMSVMRSSLLGSLLQVLKFNLDRKAERVRVFELGRVFLRDASVADHRHHRARRPPADARRRPGLWRRRRPAMGPQGPGARLLRRQGRRRGAAGAAAGASSRRPRIPAHAPGPLRRASGRRQARSAWSASCIRAGASSGSCRRRRCCSSWTSTPCIAAPGAGVRAGAALPAGRARHRGDRRRRRSRTPTLMAAIRVGRHRRPAARRHAVRRLQAQAGRRRPGARTRKAWPCA